MGAEERSESADGPEVGDGFRAFLDEIGRYPLLTPAEEVVLAKAIERGDPAARRRMVECNLRLVVAIAKPYARFGVSLADLVQEGAIGLDEATRRFDWRRGHRFSTYASWWIRHAVLRAVTNDRQLIRLPRAVNDGLLAVSRARHSLEGGLGREPTAAELASETGLPLEQVEALVGPAATPLSLNQPSGLDGGELGRLIADERADDPAEQAGASARRRWLLDAVRGLPQLERDVIERRLQEWTYDEIADDLVLARPHVRQLEQRALAHLTLLHTSGAASVEDLTRRRMRHSSPLVAVADV